MGIVIPFRPRSAPPAPPASMPADAAASSAEAAVMAAFERDGDRHDVLEAAAELLALCRDRYGFTVMQDGLPRDPDKLATALVALLRGIAAAMPDLDGRRPYPGFGVYFGRPALGWFEDGCGGRTGLAVPDRFDPNALADFLGPRLSRYRRG